MKRTAGILAFGLIATITASAQESAPTPKAEVGMNFLSTTVFPSGGVPSFTAPGGSGSFVYNFNKTFGAVADLGAYHNSSDVNLNPTQMFTYLFGPRVSLRKEKFTPVRAGPGGRSTRDQSLPGGSEHWKYDRPEGVRRGIRGWHGHTGNRPDIYLRPIEVEYMSPGFPTSGV